MTTISLGQKQDIDAWMALVEKVAWNFPGLETQEQLQEHRKTVEKFLARGTAVCAKEGSTIIGVLLFSLNKKILCCLAVDPEYRRDHIATELIRYMFTFFKNGDVLTVTTFRENDEKGIAPRALYRKLGFTEGALCVEFNYPNQLFSKIITEADTQYA